MGKYKDDIIGKMKVVLVAALIFCVGYVAGAGFMYWVLNDRYYDEVRAEDTALWIRIYAVDGDKADLMERVDRVARAIDRYDLAVAQIVAYEERQEILNVRVSDKD